MNWTIDRKQVRAKTGQVLSFKFDVEKAAEIGNFLVVLLNVPPGEVMTENVFGVLQDARIAWQIEKIPDTSTNPVNIYVDFVDLGKNLVRVFNWNGQAVDVDVQNGKVIHTKIGR